MTEIQAIKAQRLYLQVAGQLQELISRGVFNVGDRLPSERDLATQFEVSRPTIREAMIALEIAGVVEVRSGSGVYVLAPADKPPSLGNDPGPFEILEARRLIEGETCALAAQRISDRQLQGLRELLDQMERESESAEVAEVADGEFHRLIAEAAGNSALSAIVGWLWDLRRESAVSTRFHQRVRDEGSRPVVSDHRAVLEALEARDPIEARRAMDRHLQRVVDKLLAED